jgi:hypothetical protein
MWNPCRAAWCGSCYTPLPQDRYPVRQVLEEDGTIVIQRLRDAGRFMKGRNGDHLVCPFQCDLCHFRNIHRRDPDLAVDQDVNTFVAIRRANLDALWARESGTVSGNLTIMKRSATIAENVFGVNLQVTPLFPPQGPHPVEDTFGMLPAIVMLEEPLKPGKQTQNLQWGTLRKIRSVFSNYYHTTVSALQLLALRREKGTRQGFLDSPTYSEWFERFKTGCHKRMGDDIRPDRALSIEVLLEYQAYYEKAWEAATTDQGKLDAALHAAFIILGFCGGLRGEEIPMLSLDSTLKHFYKPQVRGLEHVMVALRGRIKGEYLDETCHLIPLCARTKSGLMPRLWIGRVLHGHSELGRYSGWVFRNSQGGPAPQKSYEYEFFEVLRDIQSRRPDLIDPNEDVGEVYGIGRSCRRGYTTHATNVGIKDVDIKRLARWRNVENSDGRAGVQGGTKEHYSEITQMLKTLLRATKSL